MTAFTAALFLTLAAAALPQWSFEHDMQGWTPNAHLEDLRIEDGWLRATAVDWDPMLVQTGLEIPATAWQYVAIQIEASAPGRGELFWTGETDGSHGGFSQSKCTGFEVLEGVQRIVIYPFWQAEKTIRQLRVDLYDGAEFGIQSIEVGAWGAAEEAQTDTYAWDFAENVRRLSLIQPAREVFVPPLDLDVQNKPWAAIEIESINDDVVEVVWASPRALGAQTASFAITEGARTYNVNLGGKRNWGGSISALGLRLPAAASVNSIRLAEAPEGPAELAVSYFGLENALPRAGADAHILVQFANTGGKPTEPATARLVLPPDMKFSGSTIGQPVPALEHGARHDAHWRVQAAAAGGYDLMLGYGKNEIAEQAVTIEEPVNAPRADYVSEPKPVYSPFEICAYYFPGWESHAKWDCIRETAPERKPALGYYDEGNPEVVDWQIKWARENAITCFLVDWYWSAGKQQLTHWFDAYREARYRDMLKVAIMWANHNPPGTHSAEDFRDVTREWIDNYFNLPAYYRIGGKPAVFIWAPENIRNDLGGSEAVRKSMDEAQEMARDAGYPGITFVALGYDFSKSNISALTAEGYSGVTTYHEWGELQSARGPRRVKFEDVVRTAAESWATKQEAAGPLTYYPVIDTGWDSRPWHGDDALVIEGRNVQLFHQLLQSAWQFAVNNNQRTIILGPLNEWGEGSYIEPCVEFGFKMYETLRNVFAPDAQHPVNLTPSDVGLGPYDYPEP